jgi:hypothetical protein
VCVRARASAFVCAYTCAHLRWCVRVCARATVPVPCGRHRALGVPPPERSPIPRQGLVARTKQRRKSNRALRHRQLAQKRVQSARRGIACRGRAKSGRAARADAESLRGRQHSPRLTPSAAVVRGCLNVCCAAAESLTDSLPKKARHSLIGSSAVSFSHVRSGSGCSWARGVGQMAFLRRCGHTRARNAGARRTDCRAWK